MFFIGRMNFSAFFVPYSCVYSREEGIGFRRCIIYFGQAQLVGQGYGLAMEERTTFRRLGNAPFGSDSNVLRPMMIVFPVVNALKRFRSLGSQNKSLF